MIGWMAMAALAQDTWIDGQSEPGVIDVTKSDVLVDIGDPKLDLAAFVVVTPKGEIVLDELLAAAEAGGFVLHGDDGPLAYLHLELEDLWITDGGGGGGGSGDDPPPPPPPPPPCFEIFHVRICAPA